MGQGRLLFCRSLVEAAHKYNTGRELQAAHKKKTNPSKFHDYTKATKNL